MKQLANLLLVDGLVQKLEVKSDSMIGLERVLVRALETELAYDLMMVWQLDSMRMQWQMEKVSERMKGDRWVRLTANQKAKASVQA